MSKPGTHGEPVTVPEDEPPRSPLPDLLARPGSTSPVGLRRSVRDAALRLLGWGLLRGGAVRQVPSMTCPILWPRGRG